MGDNIWLPDRDARARRCSGRPTATPASRPPTRASSTCRSCSRSSTTTTRSTWSRSSRSRARCCTGSATSSTCARRTRCSGSATSRVLPTDHESVLAFVRTYAGSGTPLRRPAGGRAVRLLASRTTPCRSRSRRRSSPGARSYDLFGGGGVPDHRRGRPRHADPRHAELLLAAHRAAAATDACAVSAAFAEVHVVARLVREPPLRRTRRAVRVVTVVVLSVAA